VIIYGPMNTYGYFKGFVVPSPPDEALRFPQKGKKKKPKKRKKQPKPGEQA